MSTSFPPTRTKDAALHDTCRLDRLPLFVVHNDDLRIILRYQQPRDVGGQHP